MSAPSVNTREKWQLMWEKTNHLNLVAKNYGGKNVPTYVAQFWRTTFWPGDCMQRILLRLWSLSRPSSRQVLVWTPRLKSIRRLSLPIQLTHCYIDSWELAGLRIPFACQDFTWRFSMPETPFFSMKWRIISWPHMRRAVPIFYT